MSFGEDDLPFVQILKSMGIVDFDPLVPIALNEYASRFALEILQDAKDYSLHANRSEIAPDDIKLAVKLNDAHTVGMDSQESVLNRVRDLVQKKSLTELASNGSVDNRYPIDLYTQRSHTYIPGREAYAEESEEEEGGDEMTVVQSEISTNVALLIRNNASLISSSSTGGAAIKFQTASRSGAKRLENAPGFTEDS